MTRKFLQIVGALTILGVLGAGAAAAFVVKQRFLVTITGEQAEQKAGPDPVTLLRDDVSSLRHDVSALSQVLSKNFETLGAQDDAADDARRKELAGAMAPIAASLAQLAQRVDALDASAGARDAASKQEMKRELAQAVVGIETRVEALAAAAKASAALAPAPPAAVPLATASPASAPSASPPPIPRAPLAVTPAAATPTAARTGADALPPPSSPATGAPGAVPAPTAPSLPGAPPVAPAVTTAAPTGPATAPAAPPTPSPAPRRKGFLAFSLPSESLEVDRPQRFEIVASLSRVGFDAKSTLHDFTGVTSETSGTFVATLARPGSGTAGHVEAASASIGTGEDARDVELRKTLDVKRYPTIAFDLVSFEATTVDAKAVTAAGVGKGRFTIHGVTRDVQIPLRISLDEGRRVVIEGEVPVQMSAYGVFPPKAMGVIAVDDRINVWVSLRARAVGRAE